MPQVSEVSWTHCSVLFLLLFVSFTLSLSFFLPSSLLGTHQYSKFSVNMFF